ncbi:MAG: hypothetical protein ABGY75_19520 [Gemmataceae bacterium]
MKVFVSSTGRFFFNLSANVGVNSPNKKDDVELVQFAYFAMSKVPGTSPALRPVFAAVKPGAAYSGAANDPLTQAIIAHQRDRGGTQDGHVSVINNPAVQYSAADGPHVFMLVRLVNNIFDFMPDDYPRLDKHPSCPAELKRAVRAILLPNPG